MASVELHPADVYIQNVAATSDWRGVNVGPIWSDGDDSTYGFVDHNFVNGHAWLPTLTDSRTVTALTLHVRAERDGGTATQSMGAAIIYDGGALTVPAFDLHIAGSIPVNGAFTDYSFTVAGTDYTGSGTDVATVAAALRAGGRALWFSWPTGTGTNDIAISEAWLEVTVASAATTRRKYPNPTGLGVGTRRHWPKPRRGVTGIQ